MKTAIAAVVVLGIIIGLILIAPFSNATVIIHIHSTHLVQTVHYRLYVDDAQQAEGDLTAGQTVTWTLRHPFSILDNKITASVMATGGALGDTHDDHQLTIADGSTYEITLTV